MSLWMLVGTPVPCEPCPSHSNFEGPLRPPFPLAFSALTLPDCPADPDKHIGISDHVWIWSDTRQKKKKCCLASSSLDLKCAEFNPCRSDVVPRMTAHQHPGYTSQLLQPSQKQGLQSPRPSSASWPPWCHFEAFEALGPRNQKRRASKLGDFFFRETPYQKWQIYIKGRNPWKFTNKIWKGNFEKKSPKLHDFWVPDVDLQGCICTWQRFLSQVWHSKKDEVFQNMENATW